MPDKEWTVEEIGPRLDDFLGPLLDAAGLELDYDVSEGDAEFDLITPDVTVQFDGRDLDLLLNQRGDLLMALEQLTLEALRVPHQDRYRIIFDANDYRLLRIEELKLSAETAADEVKRTGRPFHFNPMSSRERRIIHLALRDELAVRTESEGAAPFRHTVIYPAKPLKP